MCYDFNHNMQLSMDEPGVEKMEKALEVLQQISGAACVLGAGLLGFTVCIMPMGLENIVGDVMALVMLLMGILLCSSELYDSITTEKE
jgi:hypothetical protein